MERGIVVVGEIYRKSLNNAKTKELSEPMILKYFTASLQIKITRNFEQNFSQSVLLLNEASCTLEANSFQSSVGLATSTDA